MRMVRIDLDDAAAMDRFVEVPWRIYPGRHRWIPPLRVSVLAHLDPARSLFFRHGKAAAFLCEDEAGEPVGRVVASVDEARPDGDRVGQLGFLEMVDSEDVARALLDAAEAWVGAEGRSEIHGPIDLSIFRGYRLQTEGFKTDPFVGEPRAPSYYHERLEAAGYERHASWASWDIQGSWAERLDRASRVALALARRRQGDPYVAVWGNIGQFEAWLRRIHAALLETWRDNYGFSEIDADELAQTLSGLGAFTTEKLFGHYETPEGEVVAVAMALLDKAETLTRMDGDGTKAMQLATARTSRVIFYTFAIVPEHRQTALAYRLFAAGTAYCLREGIEHVYGALVREGRGRTVYDHVAPASRRYAIYRKVLAS